MATSNFIKICIKSDAIVTEGEEKSLSAKDTWETISQEWANNPADGEAFEWADIPSLQAGIALRRQELEGYGKCTQVYVEVDYTYTPPPAPTPPVTEAVGVPEYQKREIARIGVEAETTLKEILSRVTELSVATGDATGGSTTTLVDTSAVWEVDKWKDAVVEITHTADGKHYFVTITSNTADTLTFPAIAVTVAAGDHYEIRMTLRLADIDKWGGTAQTGLDVGTELPKKVNKATTPVIYNKTMTLADTQYSQALPANTKKYTIQTRDGTAFRLAFVTDKVAAPTEPYFSIGTDGFHHEDLIEPASLTLYFACDEAAKVVEIIAWS